MYMGSHYSHRMVTGLTTGSDISTAASRAEGANQAGLCSRPALSLSSVAKPTSLTEYSDQALLQLPREGFEKRLGMGESEGSFQETSEE